MHKKNNFWFFIPLFSMIFFSCSRTTDSAPFQKTLPLPDSVQLAYQKMETIGFIHFTVNTFTDKEWGYGDEKPELFNPKKLDAEQWVRIAKAGGLKELILTAKHHDGFCLWPSAYTEHSIKNSPYKNGKGDLVREFVDACHKHGIKAGLYLSPWDRNHKDYGKPEYISFYRNQLIELLTNYGEISEIWFDGANGGDGFYGGANENRTIDRKTYYDWDSTFALVKKLQAGIMIFSDAGPDVHWIGNELGHAGLSFWSAINRNELTVGGSDQDYLNTGDPKGKDWVVGQCDVSIRPGWFYHKKEDSAVKTAQELIDIYYKSVGRNAVLLINLPPDRNGLIHPNDSASLIAFKNILDESFAVNLAENAETNASDFFNRNPLYKPQNILDQDINSFWAATTDTASIIVTLDSATGFNRIMLQEPIHFGQRISKFDITAEVDGKWIYLYEGTTIGYKRLIRIPECKTEKIRIRITESRDIPAISFFGIYKSSRNEQL